MTAEQFNPESEIEEEIEVRIDIPGLGPRVKSATIIDGMAVVEGDIVLGPAEEYTDVSSTETPEGVVESVTIAGDSGLWPDAVVPYEIASGMPNTSRVYDAIDHWEENTPVEFVPRTTESDYVEFFSGGGCWSYVGRQGGRQRISLGGGCGVGAAIHEIAHAVGVWHQQSRSDRDVYIQINWENITSGRENNFRKHEEGNDIGRYDYDSIMHYGPYAFSDGGGKTIESPEPIGQRSGLSEGDIDAVFRLYGPSDAATKTGVTDQWTEISFDPDVDPNPVVLTGIQTFNGSDTVGVRMRNYGKGTAEVFLEEEKSHDQETTHIAEKLGVFTTDEGILFDEEATPIGRAGVVETNQPSPGEWHTVDLGRSFSNPVVFAQLMSYNGGDPAHIRVRDVRPSSFKFKIEEWRYLDGIHTTEDVGYVVLEAGRHSLRNGLVLNVGTAEADHTWTEVSTPVMSDPVVLSQTQTVNGPHEVVTRHRNVNSRRFEVRLQEEEGRDGTHLLETVGYMAISQPEEFEYGVAQSDVTHEWSLLDYEADFVTTPATVASITTFRGSNTASVRMRNPGSRETELQVEEERSVDDEVGHVEEQVAYVATPPGTVYYAAGKRLGEAGVGEWSQPAASAWHTVELDRDYGSRTPVVFAQLMSKEGGDPAHTRLRNVGPTSFEFQIEEWEYLDKAHTNETVGYVVLPTGLYPLPDGGLLQVGTVRTNHTWTHVPLDSYLSTGEGHVVVVSRCQSHNGPQAVVTRHQNVSASGFEVRLQEEEAQGEHMTETIGYLAAIHRA